MMAEFWGQLLGVSVDPGWDLFHIRKLSSMTSPPIYPSVLMRGEWMGNLAVNA